MSLSVRVGIAAVLLSAALAVPASAGKHDGRIRIDAVHDWLVALRDPVDDPPEMPTAWATALNCLHKIGPDDRLVLPELIAALNDPVARVRAAAAEAIGNVGPEAKGAVPALRGMLPKPGEKEPEDPHVMKAVISALGQIGDDAVSAADDLVLCFEGADDFLVCDSLQRFGPAAVPALERGLRDPRPRIRRGCLIVLASMRCPTPVAPDRQLELLGDQAEIKAPNGSAMANMRVGCAAVSSLARCGPSVVGSLRKLLASDQPVVRVRAASVLTLLNEFDAAIADRLAQGYRNEDLSYEVTDAIQSGKRSHDPRLLSAVHALLTDRDVSIRARAASMLIGFDAVDADVVRTEIALLSDPA